MIDASARGHGYGAAGFERGVCAMQNLLVEGLRENDVSKLLAVPKSDIHNHSSKGCRRVWLEERLRCKLPAPPDRFEGLEAMHDWYTGAVKPYCGGIVLRWEGAFAEAQRNHIARLAMNFGTQDIELVGGNGLDLARSLLRLNPLCNIIFLTSHPEYAGEALDLFCSGYVMKPLSPTKIRTQMGHLRHPVAGLTVS